MKRELRRRGAAFATHTQSPSTADQLQAAPKDASNAGPVVSRAAVPDGYYSPTDIARAMGAVDKAAAIRMALKRLFDDNRLSDGAWMENSNPAKGQARILFRLSAVRPLLARFESREQE